MVYSGIDRFEKLLPKKFHGAKAGLLIHPASVNKNLIHTKDILLQSKKIKVRAFFGPQHGIFGNTQDNMIEWEGFIDKNTGLPVYSLYGQTRKPTPQMLQGLDVLIIDLQDVGARYYTFIWTMSLCMEECEKLGLPIIVLDRVNPIGGHITEGPNLQEDFKSFVGLHPICIRHGMTIGELALYFREQFYPKLELNVIPLKGWHRKIWFNETGLHWVMPSPNMPTLDTAVVYPGMCFFEGTILSEGRGTTRPFEIFGAPFIEPEKLVKRLKDFKLKGAVFRPLYFTPTFNKFTGELCGGAQIHVVDREKFKPVLTAVAILLAIKELYPEVNLWRNPPYEYEFEKLPFDILAGSERLRKDIENGTSLKNIELWWQEELSKFEQIRKQYLLYD
ncbi:exo-beta-N-acetylmuramidase NamZ family protein [Thermodesulfovibrio hydrogeniphilus]